MNEKYYRLLFDDYSAASFTSFDKDYYGTLEQINEFFEEIKKDEELAKRQEYIISVYEKHLAGQKNISYKVAYREAPFIIPAKLLGEKTSVHINLSWEHLNTWRWPYIMKCDKAECRHIWLSCYGKYSRCIKANFTNLRYENTEGEFKKLGDMLWGLPGQISGIDGDLFNRLFVEEKVFKNKKEAMLDFEQFEKTNDINFTEILNDIFGDG